MDIHWHNIAALAYEKYVAEMATDPRFDGKVPQKFEQLNETEARAWVVAVQEACDVFGRAVLA